MNKKTLFWMIFIPGIFVSMLLAMVAASSEHEKNGPQLMSDTIGAILLGIFVYIVATLISLALATIVTVEERES